MTVQSEMRAALRFLVRGLPASRFPEQIRDWAAVTLAAALDDAVRMTDSNELANEKCVAADYASTGAVPLRKAAGVSVSGSDQNLKQSLESRLRLV